jgi:hypothetical protein
MSLLAREAGVLPDTGSFGMWEAELDADSLYDQNWLYLYEASVQGWLPSKTDLVTNDNNFKMLLDDGVSFLGRSFLEPAEEEDEEETFVDPYGTTKTWKTMTIGSGMRKIMRTQISFLSSEAKKGQDLWMRDVRAVYRHHVAAVRDHHRGTLMKRAGIFQAFFDRD